MFATMSSEHPGEGVSKCTELANGKVDTGWCHSAYQPDPDLNPYLILGYPVGADIRHVSILNRNGVGQAKHRITGATIKITKDLDATRMLWSDTFKVAKDKYLFNVRLIPGML